MAATAWVIWLRACVRYWPSVGMVYMCPLLQSFITIIITSHRARGPFCHALEKSRSPSLTRRIAASGNEIATLLVSVTVSVFMW